MGPSCLMHFTLDALVGAVVVYHSSLFNNQGVNQSLNAYK